MKLVFPILVFFVFQGVSQRVVEYGEIPNKKAKYDTYISKTGKTISVGDFLTIGLPTTDFGFRYISQNGQKSADFLAGKEVEITKIATYKGRFSNTVYLHFKGFGLIPVLINYENALKTGEIEALKD